MKFYNAYINQYLKLFNKARFYPKGTDFSQVSHRKIAELEHILNTRGRKSLGYRSPRDCKIICVNGILRKTFKG
ncbi:hypothetical protein [Symbiopectobacterium purcellii]|uniref:hypothetical protein n=1 Tax=Symbiopectobacterium purcellii TaxID=2871826 RepID=UPI003F83E287